MASNGGVELKHVKFTNGSVSPAKETVDTGDKEKNDKENDGEDNKKKEESKRIATLKELFRTATCLDVFLMAIGTLASMVHGGGWPVMMIFFGDMTNEFVSGPGGNLNRTNLTKEEIDEITSHFNEEMTKYALYYIYVGIAVLVASFIQSTSWALSCERQTQRIRKQFFSAILKQEIGWFDVHQSGELTSRLSGDLTKVKEGMGDKMSFAIQFTSAFFSGYIIGFWKGWKLTLVMLSVAPLLAIMAALMSKLMASFGKKEAESYAKAGSIAEEVLSCIRTVTSFNGQNQDMKRYDKALQESVVLGQKKSWYNGFLIGFTMFCMFGSYALALWFGSEEAKKYAMDPDTGMSPGTVLTVFFCVLVGTFSIGNISPHLGSLAEARGAAGALIEIIDNVPSIDASSTRGKYLSNVKGQIKFKNVSFRYPTREDVPVLQDLSMTVEPGQTVALVGPSGCGKSTTVNLIQRFYDAKSGEITIDGENVQDINVKSLRSNIGVVSQEPTLFGLSIKENILLGRPDASQDEIVEAAKMANCHDFIMKLPKQYDTLVGERGAQLSGGQKQRVAIARALIRDPKILLLDEATSALDTTSERIVQKALDKARLGRTTIVIAHRLSTIKNADVIYVVQDGKIVEEGKHGDLMARQGEYYQLVTVQAIVEEERGEGEEDEDVDEVLEAEIIDSKRKRTMSGGKTDRQDSKLTRQVSKQVSKQVSITGDKDEKEVDEEKEAAGKAGWCVMMHQNSPECALIFLGCVAAAFNGCAMPAFAIFFGNMIQVFVDNGKDNLLWSMMFLALGAAQLLTNIVQHVCFGYSGMRLTERMRQKTFKAYLRQDITYFDDPKHSTGALATRLSTDTALVQSATGIRLAIIIQSMFSLVAALFIAFYYGWQLALVVLGAVPLMAIAGAIQLRTVMATHKRDNVELEKAGKTSSEAIDNIRTVQALTREIYFYRQYSDFLEKPYRTALKMSFMTGLTYAFSQGIMFMLYGGCFRFGAYMIVEGYMESADVFKVFFAISMTALVMGQSASFLPEYSKASAAAAILLKTIATIPPIDIFSRKGQWPQKMSGSIAFKDVYFNYPSRPDVQVLKGISLSVEPGQTIALVGPSGCGKSTVVSLLQRYYDPEHGKIEVDGTNIKDINLVRLRYLISVVSQEPILFDTSIKENITYGLDSPISMEEIIQAARDANIHEFIANLPLGYETEVGEKGTQLSGGQKQRVAIARALVRNPRILLLDEATSALDTESEQLVQAALDNAQEGRTCIVIAHRLSTIQNADMIYVIDSGNVVEFGNHQQLLNKKGVYAQLVSGQQLS